MFRLGAARVPSGIAALGIAGLAACAGTRATANRGRISAAWCFVWDSARTLQMPDGRPVYVERPRPVAVRGGTLWLGEPTFVWGTPTQFFDSATLLRRELAEPWPIGLRFRDDGAVDRVAYPAGVPSMQGPVALPDGRGGADVVFATPADGSAGDILNSSALWYVHWSETGWSGLQRVATAAHIQWAIGHGVMTRRGDSLFLTAVADDTASSGVGGSALLLVERNDGRWVQRFERAGAFLVSLTRLELAGGASVLLYVGRGRTPADSAYGVYAMRSTNGARRWTDPTLVHRLDGGGVTTIRVATTGTGESHLLELIRTQVVSLRVFSNDATAAAGRDSVRHWRTRDGAHWTELSGFALGRTISDFDLAAGPGGGLTLVLAEGALNNPVVRTYHDGTWRLWQRFDESFATIQPFLTRVTPERAVLAYGVPHRVEELGAVVPTMRVATARGCGAPTAPGTR